MGGAQRPDRDPRRAVTGEAGDTVDADGLDGFGQAHRRQDGGEPPRQHRLPHPRRAEEEDVVGTTPTSCSPLRPAPEM